MRKMPFDILALLCVIQLVSVGKKCGPVEEGSSFTMRYKPLKERYFKPGVVWGYTTTDGHQVYMAQCSGSDCTTVYPNLSATLSLMESTLTIHNVSRAVDYNIESTLWCTDISYLSPTPLCDPFIVYYNPENPVCDDPVLSDLQTHIFIKCRTFKVYPQAGCAFLTNWDINSENK